MKTSFIHILETKKHINFISNIIKKIDKNYLFIFIVALIMISPVISCDYYYGHDTDYHISNIIAIEENISFKDKVFFPDKVVPIIANDYGYGSGIFYPKLPHYLAAYTYEITKPYGITPFEIIKIWHFIELFLSGTFMYLFVKKVFKSRKSAFLSSVFYITFPYHLAEIYLRDAFAESFMFIFIPIIFLGLYNLLHGTKKQFYIYFILGYVGAVNSHLVCSIYITLFVLIYMLFNYKEYFKKSNIISLIKASIMILLFISPFIIPMIEHKMFGDYLVFKDGVMATIESVKTQAMDITEYFKLSGRIIDKLYLFISYIALIMAIITIINRKSIIKAKYQNKILLSILFITIIAFLMTLKYFPWNLLPNFLLSIQFPWRLQLLVVFGISVLGGLAITGFNNKRGVIITLTILCSIFGLYTIHMQEIVYRDYKDIDYSLRGMGVQYEYLPTKVLDNIDYFNIREKDKIIIYDGSASIRIIENKTPYLKFSIATTDKVRLELPRIYYLGYKITINSGNKVENMKYFINSKGFIEIEVAKTGVIEVKYEGTQGAKLASRLFILALIISVVYLIKKEEVD